MSEPTNGKVRPFRQSPMVNFGDVAALLRSRDPAAGFTRAAEILLDRYNELAPAMGAAAVIKLAIDCHKHGLFCEVAADKTRTMHDAAAYEAYQKYLAGDTDLPVAAGVIHKPTTIVDVDAPESESDSE